MAAVIATAQERLDELLAAEREVHDRLVGASGDLRAAIERVAGRYDAPPAAEAKEPNDTDAIDLTEVAVVTTASSSAASPAATAEEADELGRMVRDGVGSALKDLRI